jgi:rhamnose transport system permease protein
MTRKLALSRDLILAGVIVALCLLIATRSPLFITPSNLVAIGTDSAVLFILVMGQLCVILSRCIDLSVASNLALTGMLIGMLNTALPDIPVPFLAVLATSFGFCLGAFNGLLVWVFGLPSIVVTLGTLAIFRGLIYVISGGAWVNAHEMSPSFLGAIRHEILYIPVLLWIAVAVVLLTSYLLRFTVIGRSFYTVGGNPTAAVYAGLNVGRTQFFAFCISGALAGLAGYLWVARYAVAYVEIARGFEFDVVAACVIGGVSIMGGIGTVTGALLGAIFLGVVKNALPVIGISPFWQLALSGLVIILAVMINARTNRPRGRQILQTETESAR